MRQKRILNMLNYWLAIIKNDGNNIKTSVDVQIVCEKIGIGSINKSRLLLIRHGNVRVTMIIVLSGFHLHNDQLVSIFCNNVYFFMLVTPIFLQNLIAFVGKKLSSQLLTHFPQFVMPCHKIRIYCILLRFTKLQTIIPIPISTKGTLSHWPMSKTMLRSKSTCTFFRNSMPMREPKMMTRKVPNIRPGCLWPRSRL